MNKEFDFVLHYKCACQHFVHLPLRDMPEDLRTDLYNIEPMCGNCDRHMRLVSVTMEPYISGIYDPDLDETCPSSA